MYPHLYVDGQRIREVDRVWQPGDVVLARFLVWQRHHVLVMLLQEGSGETATEELEFTSLLQTATRVCKEQMHQVEGDSLFGELDTQMEQRKLRTISCAACKSGG
jgi:hypothetical protein